MDTLKKNFHTNFTKAYLTQNSFALQKFSQKASSMQTNNEPIFNQKTELAKFMQIKVLKGDAN